MSDEGPPPEYVDRELFEKLLERTKARFTLFLMDEGLDLFHNEPLPTPDDYVRRYIDDPPTHLVGSDLGWRIERALEAWRDAARARDKRVMEATQALLRARRMACARIDLELATTCGASGIEDLEAKARYDQVRTLWFDRLWREPWVSLVNQEFPGSGPTLEELDRWEAQRPDFELREVEANAELAELKGEMQQLACECGYPLDENVEDLFVITSFATMVVCLRDESYAELTPAQRREYAMKSMATASVPDHPAWQVLLDRYFPMTDDEAPAN